MSLLRPLQQAGEALEVAADADAVTIKRAYRKKVLEHPPDSDPEGFRRVRDAYEILSSPKEAMARAKEALLRRLPAIDPPALPRASEAPPPGALPLMLLRLC